jgi:hypothetical protein
VQFNRAIDSKAGDEFYNSFALALSPAKERGVPSPRAQGAKIVGFIDETPSQRGISQLSGHARDAGAAPPAAFNAGMHRAHVTAPGRECPGREWEVSRRGRASC